MVGFRNSMESVRCDTCGADDAEPRPNLSASLSLPPPFRIVRCRRCGLCYMNPRMTAEEYRAFYAGKEYLEEYGYAALLEQTRMPEFQRTLQRLRRIRRPPGRLLDVGTATGEFLAEAQKDGWQVFGTEISASSVRAAREQFGLQVFHGDLREAPFPKHCFDVIQLSHVLEHVPSPKATAQMVRQFLRPDGVFLVEVPNEFDNWLLRLGKRLRRYRPPDKPSLHHVYFFSPKTLRASLHASGFSSRVSTYSLGIPVRTLPEPVQPLGRLITTLIDRFGGGLYIQSIATPR